MNGFFSVSEAFSIALHLCMHLAHYPDECWSTRQVADDYGYSPHHVAKIVQRLSREGIVTTRRGAQGGARLARPASQIQLIELARLLDAVPPRGCMLAADVCGGGSCLLGVAIEEQNNSFRQLLQDVSLQQLADSFKNGLMADR
jgi:Rrf2 family protein